MIKLPNARLIVKDRISLYLIFNNKIYSSKDEFVRYIKELTTKQLKETVGLKFSDYQSIDELIYKIVSSLDVMHINNYLNLMKQKNLSYSKEELENYLYQNLGVKEYTT